ncbi:MAG: peptidylprolyl isomerase [Chloroflexi bacterium]|nr:peptidylprolyl isomerase [Chloroflexota bacterium]
MTKSRPPQAGLTRKHLARAEREALLRKWVIGVTVGVIAIILAIIGYGLLDFYVLQPRQPVAKVGQVGISTADFQKAVKYQRVQLSQQSAQLSQIIQLFGSNSNATSFYQNQLTQIESQLSDPNLLGRQVLDQLIDDEIIRQEAEARGITVSPEEIDKAIQEAFDFYPNGTPTPVPTATLPPTEPPTVTPTSTEGPSPTPSATTPPTATPEPTQTSTAGPSPTPFPTSTPYTLEGFQKAFGETTTRFKNFTGMTDADFRRLFETNLLREKVTDAIAADTPREIDEAHARHILVADEAAATDLIKQLQAGADFATLAAANSLDTSNKDNGGDLGTFAPGQMVAEFDAVVFSAPLGLYPQPVQTQFGYHIIEVLSREKREMTDEEFATKKTEAFDTWLSNKKAETDLITEFSYWQLRVPEVPTVADVLNPPTTDTPEPTATP